MNLMRVEYGEGKPRVRGGVDLPRVTLAQSWGFDERGTWNENNAVAVFVGHVTFGRSLVLD